MRVTSNGMQRQVAPSTAKHPDWQAPVDLMDERPAFTPKPEAPSESWWAIPEVQASRDAFRAALARESERMFGSKEGRATAGKILEFVA